MDRTPIIHAAVAVGVQIAVGITSGEWLAGGLLGLGLYLGREHAQAEHRWIASYGANRRENMPWWGGFDPRAWAKLDPWLDWLIPALAVAGVTAWAR